jgi:hypothetical protein
MDQEVRFYIGGGKYIGVYNLNGKVCLAYVFLTLYMGVEGGIMLHISFKIGFDRKPTTMTQVTCAHCAKSYSIAISEIRVMNYCSSCK